MTATTVKEKTVVALGFFDGVHLGHRDLLEKTVKEARARNAEPLVLTFSEEGSAGLKSSSERLYTDEERLEKFRDIGIKYAVMLDFSAVRDVLPESFVADYVVGECRAVCAVCGFNFRYGKGARGDAQSLSSCMLSHGLDCIVCEPYCIDGALISSSRIKTCVASGDMQSARKMLGSHYCLRAPVLHGKALGRQLGLPTANQVFEKNKIRPRHGVYATFAHIDGERYFAVTNVGVRPSVDDGECVNCETNIMNCEKDLYGKLLTLEFCAFLRDEMRFGTLNELKQQIEKDRKEAEKWLITIGQS